MNGYCSNISSLEYATRWTTLYDEQKITSTRYKYSKLVLTSKGKCKDKQQGDTEIYPEVHFPMEANLRWSGAVFTKVKHRVALIWHTVSPLWLTTDVARHLSLCCRWGWQLEPLQGWSTLHKLEGLHEMHRAAKTRCSKVGAHTTTQLVAPGKVFIAPKAPKDHNLLGFQWTPRVAIPLSQIKGEIKSVWWKCRSRSPLSNPQRAKWLSG